jgi:hypothetical protein
MSFESIDESKETSDTFINLAKEVVEFAYTYDRANPNMQKRLVVERKLDRNLSSSNSDWKLNLILEILKQYDDKRKNEAQRQEEKA